MAASAKFVHLAGIGVVLVHGVEAWLCSLHIVVVVVDHIFCLVL